MKPPLTHERLKELLSYDAEERKFHWLVRRGNVSAGSMAGGNHGTGYKVIGIDGQLYLAHRLAWFFVHGRWPFDQIDHINGIKDDNRLSNLREADTSQNHQNMPVRVDSKSGITGVHFDNANGLWVAQIAVRGQRKTLGRFATVALASEAYAAAKANLHEFHPHVREAAMG